MIRQVQGGRVHRVCRQSFPPPAKKRRIVGGGGERKEREANRKRCGEKGFFLFLFGRRGCAPFVVVGVCGVVASRVCRPPCWLFGEKLAQFITERKEWRHGGTKKPSASPLN